jgi:hypothetical protein
VASFAVLAFAVARPALADEKPIRIWNLTASTILDLRLAPSGGKDFGRNLAKEDKDGEVDVDERLNLTNTPPGVYDVKLGLKGGRNCDVLKLELKKAGIASIEEKDLLNCPQK